MYTFKVWLQLKIIFLFIKKYLVYEFKFGRKSPSRFTIFQVNALFCLNNSQKTKINLVYYHISQ